MAGRRWRQRGSRRLGRPPHCSSRASFVLSPARPPTALYTSEMMNSVFVKLTMRRWIVIRSMRAIGRCSRPYVDGCRGTGPPGPPSRWPPAGRPAADAVRCHGVLVVVDTSPRTKTWLPDLFRYSFDTPGNRRSNQKLRTRITVIRRTAQALNERKFLD